MRTRGICLGCRCVPVFVSFFLAFRFVPSSHRHGISLGAHSDGRVNSTSMLDGVGPTGHLARLRHRHSPGTNSQMHMSNHAEETAHPAPNPEHVWDCPNRAPVSWCEGRLVAWTRWCWCLLGRRMAAPRHPHPIDLGVAMRVDGVLSTKLCFASHRQPRTRTPQLPRVVCARGENPGL